MALEVRLAMATEVFQGAAWREGRSVFALTVEGNTVWCRTPCGQIRILATAPDSTCAEWIARRLAAARNAEAAK